ncbi:MAG TPA: hypothetical protein VG755_25385 [Nannocystaceae bacterium]|nr:hypothetical protein [Nannocystaceae bacterium]
MPTPRRAWLSLLLVAAGCAGWAVEDELAVDPIDPAHHDAAVVVIPAIDAHDEPPEPTMATYERAASCVEMLPYQDAEDGTTPRQRAMFAERPRRPWPEIRKWFAARGVELASSDAIGPVFGDAPSTWSCDRAVELGDDAAMLCTRTFIVGDDLVTADWVAVLERDGALLPVRIATEAGGVAPPDGMSLGPYLRLDARVEAEGRITIHEAAPGVCAYACGHAAAVEAVAPRDAWAHANARRVIAAQCSARGTYELRGDRFVKLGE